MGFRVGVSGSRVHDSEPRTQGPGNRVEGLGFISMVYSLGLGVSNKVPNNIRKHDQSDGWHLTSCIWSLVIDGNML